MKQYNITDKPDGEYIPTTTGSTERERFEEWADPDFDITQEDDDYEDVGTYYAWSAWQARAEEKDKRIEELADSIVARDLLIDKQKDRIKELEEALKEMLRDEPATFNEWCVIEENARKALEKS